MSPAVVWKDVVLILCGDGGVGIALAGKLRLLLESAF